MPKPAAKKPTAKKPTAKKPAAKKPAAALAPPAVPSSFFLSPPEGLLVALPASHEDARGSIQNITHQSVASVALITSKGNTTRAQHWHREDAHLCYVITGRLLYYERPAGSEETPKRESITAGWAFYTGPGVEHEMFFQEDTVLLTLGNRSREQADYEADLVRLPESLRTIYIRLTGDAT